MGYRLGTDSRPLLKDGDALKRNLVEAGKRMSVQFMTKIVIRDGRLCREKVI